MWPFQSSSQEARVAHVPKDMLHSCMAKCASLQGAGPPALILAGGKQRQASQIISKAFALRISTTEHPNCWPEPSAATQSGEADKMHTSRLVEGFPRWLSPQGCEWSYSPASFFPLCRRALLQFCTSVLLREYGTTEPGCAVCKLNAAASLRRGWAPGQVLSTEGSSGREKASPHPAEPTSPASGLRYI